MSYDLKHKMIIFATLRLIPSVLEFLLQLRTFTILMLLFQHPTQMYHDLKPNMIIIANLRLLQTNY